jgi:hemerythrin
MTSLRWVDPFFLDMPRLDDAHRRLFDLVQAAIVALQAADRRQAGRAIAALCDDACGHFLDENVLMREIDFPGYYNHFEQHRRLVLDLERLQAALALRPLDAAAAVQELRSWFTLHLVNYDQELSAYVAASRH